MVRDGNCIAARAAMLILLALSIGVHYIVPRLIHHVSIAMPA